MICNYNIFCYLSWTSVWMCFFSYIRENNTFHNGIMLILTVAEMINLEFQNALISIDRYLKSLNIEST